VTRRLRSFNLSSSQFISCGFSAQEGPQTVVLGRFRLVVGKLHFIGLRKVCDGYWGVGSQFLTRDWIGDSHGDSSANLEDGFTFRILRLSI